MVTVMARLPLEELVPGHLTREEKLPFQHHTTLYFIPKKLPLKILAQKKPKNKKNKKPTDSGYCLQDTVMRIF